MLIGFTPQGGRYDKIAVPFLTVSPSQKGQETKENVSHVGGLSKLPNQRCKCDGRMVVKMVQLETLLWQRSLSLPPPNIISFFELNQTYKIGSNFWSKSITNVPPGCVHASPLPDLKSIAASLCRGKVEDKQCIPKFVSAPSLIVTAASSSENNQKEVPVCQINNCKSTQPLNPIPKRWNSIHSALWLLRNQHASLPTFEYITFTDLRARNFSCFLKCLHTILHSVLYMCFCGNHSPLQKYTTALDTQI